VQITSTGLHDVESVVLRLSYVGGEPYCEEYLSHPRVLMSYDPSFNPTAQTLLASPAHDPAQKQG